MVLDYDYDAEGKLESVTEIIEGVEGATTRYAYDERDQVTAITQSGNGTSEKRVEFNYSPTGQFEGIRRYSDVDGSQLVASTDYAYDEHNRLDRLAHSNSEGSETAFYDFGYDDANRITQIIDVDGTTDYGYDQTNQLISADHSDVDNPDESYDYDKNGNRTQSSQHGNDYITGENNQLDTDGVYTYTYDDQGNMIRQEEIASGNIRTFEWDYRNRLVAVIDETAGVEIQRVNYVYDVMGRRISKTVDADGVGSAETVTTYFVYDHDSVVLEFVGQNTTPIQRYFHGPQVDQVLAQDNGSDQPQWLLADHLGSVHDVISNSGTVLNHIAFDSFGNILNQTDDNLSTRYLFTGREFDEETGVYYYRSRYYHSDIGQFISQDRIGFEGGDSNLYRYALNSPVVYSDPSGEKVYMMYRSFVSLDGPGINSILEAQAALLAPQMHTSLLLVPDDPCYFHTNYGNEFPNNSTSATISGWNAPSENSKYGGQRLTVEFNTQQDALQYQWGFIEVQSNGESDTKFISKLLDLAIGYRNLTDAQEAPYSAIPNTRMFYGPGRPRYESYNSNSFISGLIIGSGGTPPEIPLAGFVAPGYNKPLDFPYELPSFLRN